jgi:hypothetical protein
VNHKLYSPGEPPAHDWEAFALRFVEALVGRDYAAAYAMTTQGFRAVHSAAWLEMLIERLHADTQEPLGPCRIYLTSPPVQAGDLGACYIEIGGEHNEAITPLMIREGGQLAVRDLMIGRP